MDSLKNTCEYPSMILNEISWSMKMAVILVTARFISKGLLNKFRLDGLGIHSICRFSRIFH